MQLFMEFSISMITIIKLTHYFQSYEIAWFMSEFSPSFKLLASIQSAEPHKALYTSLRGRPIHSDINLSSSLGSFQPCCKLEIIHSQISTIVYDQSLIYTAE